MTPLSALRFPNALLLPLLGLGGVLLNADDADACGCFAPPIPSPQEATFAVNQQAEQIIFEVSEGKVSAHVRILYQGDPDEFAWLLPMPNVPELELSVSGVFGLIDQQTAPVITSTQVNVCPQPKYYCNTHPPCAVEQSRAFAGADAAGLPQSAVAAGSPNGATIAQAPVQVLAQERIGSYDTITFAADEAELAVQWLNDNGFIINETMSPYMQPYLDEGMVFVASKLVPGADVDEIRPLKLTYVADAPAIPLRLTAIAAEPHMMVTAFIYADEEYEAAFRDEVQLDQTSLWFSNRNNYGAVLARQVDDLGGEAFIKEYSGAGPVFVDPTGCCGVDGVDSADWCGVANNGLCQCPGFEIDAADCAAEEELTESVQLAKDLAEKYSVMTRLSTRVSPEEMYNDPEFRPADETQPMRLNLTATRYTLSGCESQIIDVDEYEVLQQGESCAGLYCDYGSCAMTAAGPGCICDDNAVARTFIDSDGIPSVTCVPDEGRVDFAAGGLEVPDACDGVDDPNGSCLDIGGFATMRCEAGMAAVTPAIVSQSTAPPGCAEVILDTEERGAVNHTKQYETLRVCAPPPPSCPLNGWLAERPVSIEGEDCGDTPDPSWFEVPPEPECGGQSQPQVMTVLASTGDGADTAQTRVRSDDVNALGQLDTTAPRPTEEDLGDAVVEPRNRGCNLGVGGQHSGSTGLLSLGLLLGVTVLNRRRRQR